MYKYKNVAVVIPAYNEEKNINCVLSVLRKHFTNIIVVDDCSTDKTIEIANKNKVTVISHSVNLGQGASIETGFSYCRDNPNIEYIATYDADGQHNVSDLLLMVDELRSNSKHYDIIIGNRITGGTVNQPLIRKYLIALGTFFVSALSGVKMSDSQNGLRVLTRRAIKKIKFMENRMAHSSEFFFLINENNLSFKEMPSSIYYDDELIEKGQSNMNAIKIAFRVLLIWLRRC